MVLPLMSRIDKGRRDSMYPLVCQGVSILRMVSMTSGETRPNRVSVAHNEKQPVLLQGLLTVLQETMRHWHAV